MNSIQGYKQTASNSRSWGWLLTVYIALKPVYLGGSGSLQISDLFLVFGTMYMFISSKGRVIVPRCATQLLKALFMFVSYIVMVNMLWSFTGYSYLKPVLYYAFNVVAVMVCCCIYQAIGLNRLKQAVLDGLVLSAMIDGIGLVLNGGGARAIGFFNNPNQLGYYGVAIISLLLLCKRDQWGFKETFVFAVGGWSVICSMSKAAMLAIIVQCVLAVIFIGENKSPKTVLKRVFLVAGIGIAIYVFMFTDFISDPRFGTVIRMRNRLLVAASENDSDLGAGRGYNRIAEMGIHLLWGMGEGNYNRFTVLNGLEAHSTYASVIVSYGLFGSFLYVSILCKVICKKEHTWKNLTVMSGPLLYSITHNGIRNTLVWIIMAAIFVCNSDCSRLCRKEQKISS